MNEIRKTPMKRYNIINQSEEIKMVRHAVYTTVSTFGKNGNLVRDSIGVGGRQFVAKSKAVFNVDANGGKNQRVEVVVSVDESGKATVELTCPTTILLSINKPTEDVKNGS